MGIWSCYTRDEPPTATDVVEGIQNDEKALEAGSTPPAETSASRHHASLEVERRVVRKLDMRLVPLTAVLCMAAQASPDAPVSQVLF